MPNPTPNRSWKIAAAASLAGTCALAVGLFLAVGRDSIARDDVKVISSDDDSAVSVISTSDDPDVKVVRVLASDDPEANAEMAAELAGAKGPYLGVDVREETKSNEGGALVESVVDGSPADKAGLKEGDVIVGFSGDVIRGPARLTEKIRGTKPGEKVSLDVRRDGKPVKLQVEMGERPKMTVWSWKGRSDSPLTDEQQKSLEDSLRQLDDKMPEMKSLGKMKIYSPGHGFMLWGQKPLLGVEMVETTADLREAMGGSKDAGVLVGKVLSGSAAEKAGLKVGDLILSIDGTKVVDSGDVMDAVRQREGKTVDIEAVRDHKAMHIRATLPKINEPEDQPTGPRASSWRGPAAKIGRQVAAVLARLAT